MSNISPDDFDEAILIFCQTLMEVVHGKMSEANIESEYEFVAMVGFTFFKLAQLDIEKEWDKYFRKQLSASLERNRKDEK